MATTAYRALPFLLCNLPEPDEPVTLADLRDAALPLLRNMRGTSSALAPAVARDTVRLDDLAAAMSMLTAQLDLCCDLIDRATRDR